jgi:ADP-L-glycero-D-manno-heptose 6-epimerase
MHIITGGAGFIGSNLVRMLGEKTGDDIVVVDDLRDGHKFVNIADLSVADYFDVEEFATLLDTDPGYMKNVQSVLHEGACSTTTEWDGRYMMQNNFGYSKNLLHHCLDNNIPFLYASSAAVYGGAKAFVESTENELPLNVYGYSKLLFDQYVRRISLAAGQQVVGFRYLEKNEVCLFEGTDGYADGEQRRDFVFVDDICAMNLWFLEHRDVSGIFNAGTGKAQSFNDVADAVIAWHGKGKKTYIPFPEHLVGAYQSYTEADLSNLRKAGCDIEFHDVASGVSSYLDTLAG